MRCRRVVGGPEPIAKSPLGPETVSAERQEMRRISEEAWRIVVCPLCRNPLSRRDKGAAWTVCGQEYRDTDEGQLDLRLRKVKSLHLEFHLGEKIQDTKPVFPRLPRGISRSMILPLDRVRRFWWRLGYPMTGSETSSEGYRLLRTAGAFAFVAAKPIFHTCEGC